MQAQSRRQLRFILLWRRQRHRRPYVCYGFGSFNAQCWAKRITLRYNGYFEKVQKNHMRLTATGSSANKRVCTSVCSWFQSVQLLDETPAILLLHQLCSKREYSYEWNNGETLRLTKNGKAITCTMDNSVLLVVSRLSSYSSSILSLTTRSTDQSTYSRTLGPLSDPVTTRSDKHACGKPMLTDHDKQTTGNRQNSRRNEQGRSNTRHSCLVTAHHS